MQDVVPLPGFDVPPEPPLDGKDADALRDESRRAQLNIALAPPRLS